MVRWIPAWLSNQLTWVTIDGARSRTVTLKQGVPQGSVLSTLHIDDLAVGAPQVIHFTNDVAEWTQYTDLERVTSRLQKGLDTGTSWSTSWKTELQAQKSECSIFTTNTHEARWRQALYLSRQQIMYRLNPKFLGITYHDRQLTLRVHCRQQNEEASWSVEVPGVNRWGYEKSILRSAYKATGRSTVENAAAAWLPWVSILTMEKLEMFQRYAGRAITRQIKTIPVEAILAEADLQTIATRATQLSTIAMEKFLGMPDTNPRKQIATAEVCQCTKKTNWRKKASEIHTTRNDSGAPATQATNWKSRLRGG